MGNKDASSIRIKNIISDIDQILSILSFVGITGSVLVGYIRKSFWDLLPIIFFLIAFSGIKALQKQQRRVIAFFMNLFAPDLPYLLTHRKCIYKYNDIHNMSYTVLSNVCPLKTGVESIPFKYNWTGSDGKRTGTIKPICKRGYEKGELIPRESTGGFIHYDYRLKDRRTKKDGPFRIGVNCSDLSDTEKKSQTYLSATITERTEELHLKLVFPRDLFPKNIWKYEYLHASDYYHWNKESVKAELDDEDKNWIIEWSVQTPIFGGKYIIQWEFDK